MQLEQMSGDIDKETAGTGFKEDICPTCGSDLDEPEYIKPLEGAAQILFLPVAVVFWLGVGACVVGAYGFQYLKRVKNGLFRN